MITRVVDNDGYWQGRDEDLGLSELRAGVTSFALARLAEFNYAGLWTELEALRVKPFYFNLLRATDGILPEILTHAQRFMFGELSHVGVFVSGHFGISAAYQGTQHWHFDRGDPRHIKLFCLLTDATMQSGPLMFLPTDASSRYLGRTKVADGEVDPAQVIAGTGPAGAVTILNTSECLHYGSRGQGWRRLTLVLHWCSDAKGYSSTPSGPFQDLNVAAL